MNRANRFPVRAAATLAGALALAGCATLERDEVAAPPGGGSVAMRAGTPLVVSLPPDPATGTGWVLQSGSPNLALIGGPDYTPAPRPPGLVGVADTTVFRFRAQAAGDAALVFAWAPPPGQAPARTVRYDVRIDPPPLTVADVFATGGGGAPAGKGAAAGAAPAESAGTAPAPGKAGSGDEGRGPIRYWSF